MRQQDNIDRHVMAGFYIGVRRAMETGIQDAFHDYQHDTSNLHTTLVSDRLLWGHFLDQYDPIVNGRHSQLLRHYDRMVRQYRDLSDVL